MPIFKIFPKNQDDAPIIEVNDAASIIYAVQRLECKDVDVLRDEEYCFSLSLDGNGVWSILKDEVSVDVPNASAAA